MSALTDRAIGGRAGAGVAWRRWGSASSACLICVAGLLVAAAAVAGPPATVVKGPYLQELGATSVEVRVELDAPAPVAVEISGGADAAGGRTVRDSASDTMHVVRIEGLAPSTRYTYALTVGATRVAGELTTAPPNDSSAPFSFVIYGDNRTDDVAHAAIVRAMMQAPFDFAINTGDLVQDGASAADWQSFFAIEAPLLRDHAVFACVGNHEITDGAGANYLRYFGPDADAHGVGAKPRLYGSFRWEDARFFLLDAMDPFDSDSERAWLDEELARADTEPGLVWRIVVMHHGMWSAGPHGGNARAIRAGIPELLLKHHVDLVLAGHDHIYERGFASGLRYVVSGGGGAPLYDVDTPLPSTTRKVESAHHFIQASVQADAIRLVTKRDDGSVLERCGLTKGKEGWDCDPRSAAPLRSDAPVAPPPAAAKCGCTTVGSGVQAPVEASALVALAALVAARRRRPRNRG